MAVCPNGHGAQTGEVCADCGAPIAAEAAVVPGRVSGKHHAGAPRPAEAGRAAGDDTCPWCGNPSPGQFCAECGFRVRGPFARQNAAQPWPRPPQPDAAPWSDAPHADAAPWSEAPPPDAAPWSDAPPPDAAPWSDAVPQPAPSYEPAPSPEAEPDVASSTAMTSWSAVPASPPAQAADAGTRTPSAPPESLFPPIAPPDSPIAPWEQPRLSFSLPARSEPAMPDPPPSLLAPSDPRTPDQPASPEDPNFHDWFRSPDPFSPAGPAGPAASAEPAEQAGWPEPPNAADSYWSPPEPPAPEPPAPEPPAPEPAATPVNPSEVASVPEGAQAPAGVNPEAFGTSAASPESPLEPVPVGHAAPTTPIPKYTPTTWSVVVTADQAYFDRMQMRAASAGPALPFPADLGERRFALAGTRMRIGRRSTVRGVEPEIDLSGPPADPGISRLHALLLPAPDGSWALLDVGSANGTLLNGNEIATGDLVPLNDGDLINLGAWTAITVRRE